MNKRYSLYKIEQEDTCPFDASAYSKFKFGDTFVAQQFGKELFEGFIKEHKDIILAQSEILVLPSPYFAIPTASDFLCEYFKKHLNYFLFKNGKKSCVTAKIHRNQTYTQDYGNMSYEQRVKLISGDTYYIDRAFIEDKFCLLIDDIKITGSHEVTVNRILEEYNVQGDFFFLYYAELMNKEIHPSIENFYNYFSIKQLKDIITLMQSEYFVYNTRVVKYILLSKPDDFHLFLEHTTKQNLKKLFELAISNNYHQIAEYQRNIFTLDKLLH
ncbi:MAG: phosphoribosyltransferase family protein [Capnocytophaga sp.]|nr:phosphoribosyltransferase family protein [Capnocytophaga sp.]